ncbi:YdeI/OmpD-associated family protein [Flavobacteriaceae bacterium M23B6Z8]
MKRPELDFPTKEAFRAWLEENHTTSTGIYLILYRLSSDNHNMRWEEAVQEALCFGWIDSTVKRIDDERRRQLFTPRKPKSVWSKLNKSYIKNLIKEKRMHPSGLAKIAQAKKDGSWTALDDVENGIIPEDLQKAFDENPKAFENYNGFSRGYRKSYLYWLNQAKREATRQQRIEKIIELCAANVKSR